MAAGVIACPQCGAKNRLQARPGKMPVCGRCQAPLPWLVDAGDATFDAELAAPTPVLVDLWAPWCGPCLTMAPALEELARDLAGKLKVVKVDIDRNPAVRSRFQVQGIPLLVLLRDGEVLEKMVGARPKAALAQALRAYL